MSASAKEIERQLGALPQDDSFRHQSDELTAKWKAQGAGLDHVDPVLRFMESHPDIDYGAPGALVHFVEEFYRRGYEPLLVKSVERRPTAHTLLMLRRLLNGAETPGESDEYYALADKAARFPDLDEASRWQIEEILSTRD